ncbi:ADA HAT complex component 1 [Cordyceps militaris]|uniref:ADA HAT complex component 1 n=1 Tax=Cordyceps militaris TaxID=73501 RepID=A0A2H4S8P6_CORMI|nr:ADA HAT complex component 1 [Cordyceps militaris]
MSKAKGTRRVPLRAGHCRLWQQRAKEMTLDDLRLLVEWKLRHGKFRPMLSASPLHERRVRHAAPQRASLMGRLRVGATDVEKVAYVLMRREGADGAAEEAEKDAKATARTAHKAAKAAKVEEARTAKAAKKEKRAKSKTAAKVSGKEQTQGAKTVRQPPAQTKRTAAQEDEPTSGTRRSKRVKR